MLFWIFNSVNKQISSHSVKNGITLDKFQYSEVICIEQFVFLAKIIALIPGYILFGILLSLFILCVLSAIHTHIWVLTVPNQILIAYGSIENICWVSTFMEERFLMKMNFMWDILESLKIQFHFWNHQGTLWITVISQIIA